MYAIVDIETTGGSHRFERITEISVLVHDGHEVVDEFTSLINPERPIPPHITALTGISDEMVAGAPRFFEVARKLVEMTRDRIFVAHNVSFDYGFIREEFRQLGYDFRRKQLCTVRMSRKLIPGLRSYSLGKLCDELGIGIQNRHRASGDARATARLFELLLSLDEADPSRPSLFGRQALVNLHPGLSPAQIQNIPQETGVYYFLDEKGDIIYIGKSKNLYQRVITHLQNLSTRRSAEMRDRIADIDFETTGSELVALLKESYEIKKNKPLYNRARRRSSGTHGIFTTLNESGYRCFYIDRNKPGKTPLASFSTLSAAREYLEQKTEELGLCQKLAGLYMGNGACFQYQIGICRGACVAAEPAGQYNERADRLQQDPVLHQSDFFIIDRGRHDEEYAVVKIENGSYRGYGFIDISLPAESLDTLHECIRPYPDNRDARSIIHAFLNRSKNVRVIPFRPQKITD